MIGYRGIKNWNICPVLLRLSLLSPLFFFIDPAGKQEKENDAADAQFPGKGR
jgi:hypothetical protein